MLPLTRPGTAGDGAQPRRVGGGELGAFVQKALLTLAQPCLPGLPSLASRAPGSREPRRQQSSSLLRGASERSWMSEHCRPAV